MKKSRLRQLYAIRHCFESQLKPGHQCYARAQARYTASSGPGAATMVESYTAAVGLVVDQERVVDLPLNDCLATQLITLAGAPAEIHYRSLGANTKFLNGGNYTTVPLNLKLFLEHD